MAKKKKKRKKTKNKSKLRKSKISKTKKVIKPELEKELIIKTSKAWIKKAHANKSTYEKKI